MTRTYTQKSIQRSGDGITLDGAVDGVDVQVHFWYSHIQNMDPPARIQYVTQLMREQADSKAEKAQNWSSSWPDQVTLG